MAGQEVEIKVETTASPKTTNPHKYSAISDQTQQDDIDGGESSDSDDLVQTLHQLYEDNVLLMFLQQILRESSNFSNAEIPGNVVKFCGEYVGNPEQIKFENELNDNFKLLEYNNMKHEDDKSGCMYGCKQTQHIKSWILTILLLVLIFWGIICDATSYYSVQTCQISFWYDYWWLVILFLLYICYFVEFMLSSTARYLYNMYETYQFQQYIEGRIRLLSPRIWIEFKHIDSKQITKSKHFVYSKWKDISDKINDLYLNDNDIDDKQYTNQLIKLKIDRFVIFENAETAKICNRELDDYISDEIERKSEYFDMENGVAKRWVINDDDNKKNILLHIGTKSFQLSLWFYFIVSCILCSTCYRIWFSSQTTQRRYKIIKLVSL